MKMIINTVDSCQLTTWQPISLETGWTVRVHPDLQVFHFCIFICVWYVRFSLLGTSHIYMLHPCKCTVCSVPYATITHFRVRLFRLPTWNLQCISCGV